MFYMQHKGCEKAAKVVEFVAKWLNLCLSTVIVMMQQYLENHVLFLPGSTWGPAEYFLPLARVTNIKRQAVNVRRFLE